MTAIRFVSCSRVQDSQALSEKPMTTQNAVARMTVFSSADTVRRFSMATPSCGAYLGQDK